MENGINNEKGQVLVITLIFMALMMMSLLYLGNMMKQDVALIKSVKLREQALSLAEAGIYHALAEMKQDGYENYSDFSGNLDTGSYDVTYLVREPSLLITSVGAVGGITAEVSVEVESIMPESLYYVMSAGDDVQVYSSIATAEIDGDLRANDDVKLSCDLTDANLYVDTKNIATVDILRLGTSYNIVDSKDLHVIINGVASEDARDLAVVDEGAPPMTFPTFDYQRYKEAAIDSGDYYDTGHTFSNETLNPANGIVYVEGLATFDGVCDLYGGIVANDILVNGTLTQYKSGDKNVIIAKTWQINVQGTLDTQEALIYTLDDINSVGDNAVFDINGAIVCREDILIQGMNTAIDIDYVYTYPVDMQAEGEEQLFRVVSWIY
ncbi:MAG: hypothetical protein PVH45_00780 [Candidatus Omnitrophota bacterium]|jgi:hypothetical protein